MFMSVLLPEPEEPMIATNSPLSIVSDTPARARTCTSPVVYTFMRFSTWMRVSAIARILSEAKPVATRGGSAGRGAGGPAFHAGVRDHLIAFAQIAAGELG